MKIAISTENDYVAQHFGRCPEYTIATIEKGKITSKETIKNPGHKPGFLPKFLSEKNVNCIIAGGMGQRAKTLFSEREIDTLVGITGPVDEVLEDFSQGNLVPGEDLCDR